VVTEITGAAATGRIRSAAAITREDIEELFADHIRSDVALHWDEASTSARAPPPHLSGSRAVGRSDPATRCTRCGATPRRARRRSPAVVEGSAHACLP